MKKIFSLAFAAMLLVGGSPAFGDLILTEFMANPASLSDDFGEYVEVFNSGPSAVALDGLTLGDADGQAFLISGTGLSVGVGEYFVFGDSENTDTPSYIDLAWTESSFSLTNTTDEIIILDIDGVTELLRLDYTDGDPFGAGTAAVLSSLSADDSDEDNFIAEAVTIGATTGGTNTDLGSPGAAGATAAVPEPSSIALLGLLGLAGAIRRRK